MKVAQSCPTLRPHGLHRPWNSSGQNTESGKLFSSPGDLPNPGIEPRSPTFQAFSLPAELKGKPKNTGVGSLSLLQWIFLTQELNQGLLHCRQILYQLSYQGSPISILQSMKLWLTGGRECEHGLGATRGKLRFKAKLPSSASDTTGSP